MNTVLKKKVTLVSQSRRKGIDPNACNAPDCTERFFFWANQRIAISHIASEPSKACRVNEMAPVGVALRDGK